MCSDPTRHKTCECDGTDDDGLLRDQHDATSAETTVRLVLDVSGREKMELLATLLHAGRQAASGSVTPSLLRRVVIQGLVALVDEETGWTLSRVVTEAMDAAGFQRDTDTDEHEAEIKATAARIILRTLLEER